MIQTSEHLRNKRAYAVNCNYIKVFLFSAVVANMCSNCFLNCVNESGFVTLKFLSILEEKEISFVNYINW